MVSSSKAIAFLVLCHLFTENNGFSNEQTTSNSLHTRLARMSPNNAVRKSRRQPAEKLNSNYFIISSREIIAWGINNDNQVEGQISARSVIDSNLFKDPRRTVAFSFLMAASGAMLGPFLDSFHSAFGVLRYDAPITATLWGIDDQHPALITAWWVPELFGLAGFLIGWLYLVFDQVITVPDLLTEKERKKVLSPTPPKILLGISIFTFQYWLSGILYHNGVDRTTILNIMSVAAASSFWFLDRTFAGFLVSAATALGGPLIEIGLLTLSRNQADIFLGAGYHYNDLGETGFFPLWIVPVYFLGGPANGNLARGYWILLNRILGIDEDAVSNSFSVEDSTKDPPDCKVCHDTRRVPCPNWYVRWNEPMHLEFSL